MRPLCGVATGHSPWSCQGCDRLPTCARAKMGSPAPKMGTHRGFAPLSPSGITLGGTPPHLRRASAEYTQDPLCGNERHSPAPPGPTRDQLAHRHRVGPARGCQTFPWRRARENKVARYVPGWPTGTLTTIRRGRPSCRLDLSKKPGSDTSAVAKRGFATVRRPARQAS